MRPTGSWCDPSSCARGRAVAGRGHIVAEPQWGAVREDIDAPAVGPAFDLLADLDSQVSSLQELLGTDALPVADLPEFATRLHSVLTRFDAVHHCAVAMVEASGALPPGPVTINAWLAHSHRVDRMRAGRLRRNAAWLAAHPATAAAFAAGAIAAAHVTAMRVVADATDIRRAAFPEFEGLILEAAANADARRVGQIMSVWAETVDPDAADDDADADYDRRSVYLSEVGDGWDLRGWLPGLLGAELAGVLNAFMERARRETDASDTVGDSVPASARRADALLDVARSARAADLGAGSRDRAQVAITIGIDAAHECPACETDSDVPVDNRATSVVASPGVATPGVATSGVATPGVALLAQSSATWAVGNGSGQGQLPRCLARWATCDGDVTRVVLGPDSRPLDVGRSHRVVPAYLRRVLDLRDGGCVIPGCDRPAGWCEAHHIVHWAAGGVTSVENLALICRRHHTELHLGRWVITIAEGIPVAVPTPKRRKASSRRVHDAGWHRKPEAA